MNELALFAGAGGGILAGEMLGWRTVCAVEWEPYPASVLIARQNDKVLPAFPIWDDVQTFDGKPWRGIVDVVSGGFPCQDISAAGKGAGIDGERSGMWREMARIICEVRPRFAFVENSPMLTSRGLGTVLGDLAAMGFDARWGVLGAADVGGKHQRDRIWIVAHSHSIGCKVTVNGDNNLPKRSICSHKQNIGDAIWGDAKWCVQIDDWASYATKFLGMDDGVAGRMDRLKAIGNGQVPLCAATAWQILSQA
jgi:DNA (cytosine-5)-methyltransferase 1